MTRLFALACTIAAIAFAGISAAAETARPMKIACRMVLPESEIPGNHGHSIRILEVTVPGGHDSHRHQHDSVEYLYVVSGSGSLSVDGRADAALVPGTVVTIPGKTPHQARNASATADLVFTATFIEPEDAHTITVYLGETDREHGCPHKRTPK
ncbi:MAG: cupin domain-containing protein [Bdellovibrionales bacterium]